MTTSLGDSDPRGETECTGAAECRRVPLNTWWKFAMPLVLMLAGVIVVVLSAGALLQRKPVVGQLLDYAASGD